MKFHAAPRRLPAMQTRAMLSPVQSAPFRTLRELPAWLNPGTTTCL
jgi:hypothetical protein